MIGLYELLGNLTTYLIEPPGTTKSIHNDYKVHNKSYLYNNNTKIEEYLFYFIINIVIIYPKTGNKKIVSKWLLFNAKWACIMTRTSYIQWDMIMSAWY